jgi:hypothetical protein
MCGGVAYRYKNIKESELEHFYSPEEIEKARQSGRVESFFWQKQASLPIITKDGLKLCEWGNKDKTIKLPLTGWARSESIEIGKWDYLRPEFVDIFVDSGYEKKVWFDFRGKAKGLLFKDNGKERVYMITKEAGSEYQKLTGHDREPLGYNIFDFDDRRELSALTKL